MTDAWTLLDRARFLAARRIQVSDPAGADLLDSALVLESLPESGAHLLSLHIHTGEWREILELPAEDTGAEREDELADRIIAALQSATATPAIRSPADESAP